MKFVDEIEALYEQDISRGRCRHLIICGIVALVLYDCFLLSDWRLVPDIFMVALTVRLGVVTPLALLIVAILLRQPSARVREASQATISVLVAASVLVLTLVSHSPLAVYHHYGIILVVLFANVVQRLHFPYAVAASVTIVFMYACAIGGMMNLPAEAAVSSVMILTGGAVFTLVANYTLERQFRIAYLLSLKDRLRQQELEGLARIDPLTGLGNRRELDHRLARLGTEADAATTISVMMIDVDHFKSYNDGYGHLAGDQCLKRIAAIVTAELRSVNDSAFRFGGEEFLIVLKGTEISEALEVAERLRQAVETAAIPHLYSGTAPVLTISTGVAAAAVGRTADIHAVVLAADGALYTAKRNGRNSVWPKPPRSAGVANFPAGRRVRSTG